MKKFIGITVALLLVALLVFNFVGCNRTNGMFGKSAYEIWLEEGHTGTQSDFLNWLKGTGTDGFNGKSAYEIWLEEGHTGTQSDFLNWLKGTGTDGTDGFNGKSAYEIWLEEGNTGTQAEFLDWLKGAAGTNGTNGESPYIGSNGNWWIGNQDTGYFAGEIVENEQAALFDYHPIGGLNSKCLGYAISIGRAKYLPDIVIPSKYNGLPVLHIEDEGFSNASMRSVFISNSIVSIGTKAFLNCNNLADITLGFNGIKSIGDKAFYGCPEIKRMILSGIENIGSEVFSYSETTKLFCAPASRPTSWAEDFNGNCQTEYGIAVSGITNIINNIELLTLKLNTWEIHDFDLENMLKDTGINYRLAFIQSSNPSVAVVSGSKLVATGCGRASLTVHIYDLKTHYYTSMGNIFVINERQMVEIRTAQELQNMNRSGKYILKSDINLSGISWEPIGDFKENSFTGMFVNPEGYVIRNLTINSTNHEHNDTYASYYGGLFASTIGAYIDGIILENVSIDLMDCDCWYTPAGGIVGVSSSSFILDCEVSGVIKAESCAGGIVGSDSWGYYKGCKFAGTVESGNKRLSSDHGAGGIAGFSGAATNYGGGIYDCIVNATIVSKQAAGGIAGIIVNNINYVPQNCIFTGTVSGNPQGEIYGYSKSTY